ncbi:MAG TPA: PaaI family thioesterase [Thalassobaculum sp.]
MAAKVSVGEMNRIMREEVPMAGNLGILFESITDGQAVARLPFREDLLRPGGTVTGPAMMAMADVVMYAAVLSRIGPVKLAVTTSLNANFLRRPKPGDLLADGRLIKCGRRLAYGEVTLVSADAPEDPVCHVTCTYSIPPEEAR